jgi:sodium-dependent phosphate cotransporter
MGANIGTTVTCAIVSLGHVRRHEEFRRAFAAANVHDFFNLIAVLILFPLEITTHFLSRTAQALSNLLVGGQAITFASPVKAVIAPAVNSVVQASRGLVADRAPMLVVGLGVAFLLFSLYLLVRQTKRLALARAEIVIDRLIGRSGATGMAVGAGVTAVIQSSSVTTSLLVPLAGAGVVTLDQVFPVALGANVGTTVTALLASLSGGPAGLTIALVHTLFNVTGILIVYPFRPVRRIPMLLAKKLADRAVISKRYVALFVIGLFYVVPALLILLTRL